MTNARWAEQALTDLERLVVVLVSFPNIASLIEGMPIRKMRITGTNFILFYRATGDGIEIARLFHARQDWRSL